MADGRRSTDDEILRVRDHVHQIANDLQGMLVTQTETTTLLTEMRKDLEEMKASMKTVSDAVGQVGDVNRRLIFLERIVFGACVSILLTVLAAVLSLVVLGWTTPAALRPPTSLNAPAGP